MFRIGSLLLLAGLLLAQSSAPPVPPVPPGIVSITEAELTAEASRQAIVQKVRADKLQAIVERQAAQLAAANTRAAACEAKPKAEPKDH